MSAYTRFVSRILFPLHEKLKHHDTVTVLNGLERTQWWSRGQLEALQMKRLRDLLGTAQERVPYYRELFQEHEIAATKIVSLNDIRRLPFLTKALIRSNLERLKADGAAKLARFNTGGSSGEPLKFFIGKERVSHDVAAKWRATRWWGVDIGDREIVVWGSPIELGAQDRLRMIRDRLLRTKLLPAFDMSEARLDEFINEIRTTGPRMLFGYPSALSLIARHAERRGIVMCDLDIKVAFVTSERLYDDQKAAIERVFGCRVANGYGGRDAGFIAHECPAGGMHVTAEDLIVETVRPDGSACATGEAGEIVVTHLATRDFPFIRYRTGDIGSLSHEVCPCGRGLPLLKEIQGRTTDFVVAADGKVMHGLALIYVLREVPGIRTFKIEQESRARTRVLIEPDRDFDAACVGRIKQGLRARLGSDVDVDVQLVQMLESERSGKFRYVVSHAVTA